MKEKKRNYKKIKVAPLLAGKEQITIPGDLQRNEVLPPEKIIFNRGLHSTDFALKSRGHKNRPSPQQKVNASQSSGSHSLTALRYFKSSGR